MQCSCEKGQHNPRVYYAGYKQKGTIAIVQDIETSKLEYWVQSYHKYFKKRLT